MQRAFSQRNYDVRVAYSVAQAGEVLRTWLPEFAVLDLRMPGPAGLTLISKVKAASPDARIVMLTGFSSIATAVEAIKLGATYYLVKPVDADAVEAAFRRTRGDDNVMPSENLLSVQRLAWEHIQHTLSDHGGNISATARALHMPRRTLQRKLNKHPTPR
jgi:two-component system response regulator RegA